MLLPRARSVHTERISSHTCTASAHLLCHYCYFLHRSPFVQQFVSMRAYWGEEIWDPVPTFFFFLLSAKHWPLISSCNFLFSESCPLHLCIIRTIVGIHREEDHVCPWSASSRTCTVIAHLLFYVFIIYRFPFLQPFVLPTSVSRVSIPFVVTFFCLFPLSFPPDLVRLFFFAIMLSYLRFSWGLLVCVCTCILPPSSAHPFNRSIFWRVRAPAIASIWSSPIMHPSIHSTDRPSNLLTIFFSFLFLVLIFGFCPSCFLFFSFSSPLFPLRCLCKNITKRNGTDQNAMKIDCTMPRLDRRNSYATGAKPSYCIGRRSW